MSTSASPKSPPPEVAPKKPGFFQRIFSKLDASMKQKAEAKSSQSCCSGKDGQGGKCC